MVEDETRNVNKGESSTMPYNIRSWKQQDDDEGIGCEGHGIRDTFFLQEE